MRGLVAYFRSFIGFSGPARQLLLGHLILGIAGSIDWLILNFYLQARELGEAFIGRFNALPATAVIACALPLGRWSDRIGCRRAIVLGAALGIGSLAGFALLDAPEWLAAAAVVGGVGGLLLQGNTPPFLAQHSTAEERTHLFSAQSAIATGTGLLGSILGGFLPRGYALATGGLPTELPALRATLVVAAAIGALSLLVFFDLPGGATGRGAADTSALDPADSLPRALFAKLLLPHALVGLGAGCTMPFMNLYIKGKFGVEYEVLGLIFGWSSLFTALSMLVQPWLAGRFGKARAIMITQGASIPFLLALGYAPYFWIAAIALFLRGALMNMAVPVYNAFAMELVPVRRRAQFVGLEMMMWNAGWAAGSSFSGVLREKVGFDRGFAILFGIMAAMYVSSIAVFFTFFGRASRRAAQAASAP